jgi:hypothetical protein
LCCLGRGQHFSPPTEEPRAEVYGTVRVTAHFLSFLDAVESRAGFFMA